METTKLTLELNLADDVLIEILLRLPLLSLELFKSVSKHWLSLITSEYFTGRLQKYRIDSTPCGLFTHKNSFSIYYNFVTMGPKVTSSPLRATVAEAGRDFEIKQSCNGLLLCKSYASLVIEYCVYNPFTKKVKTIPFPWKTPASNIILAFDPTKSPYYKVMITGKTRGEDLEEERDELWEEDSVEVVNFAEPIQIYSSETGKWSACCPPFHGGTYFGLDDGIYWNKAIHWINDIDELHYKLDIVDHPMVTRIQTPALDKDVHHRRHTKLFESRGSLLLLKNEISSQCRYHVFEMREESSEWLVKYILDDLINMVPVRIPRHRQYNPFLCIVSGEREDDSFMVLESDNKIVRYNFVSKTVSTLSYFPSSGTYSFMRPVPFIASLAGV